MITEMTTHTPSRPRATATHPVRIVAPISAPSTRDVVPSVPNRTSQRRLLYRVWSHLPVALRRRVVHVAMPVFTMGVCAVILDTQRRLLLVHHTYRPQAWGLPGGFARAHEQPAATLVREVREILGVGAVVGPLLSVEVAPAGDHLTLYYRATLVGSPRCDGVEIDAARYMAASEIETLCDGGRPRWLAPLQESLGLDAARAA